MATYDNSYSRLVAWLKIALPLLALGILSTLFLVARSLDPEMAIPYADVDVDQLIREQRLSSPAFSGVTDDGAAISMAAASIRPEAGDSDRLTAQTVTARIDLPTGAFANMEAPSALIDDRADTAVLTGGVSFSSSDGYRIDTGTLLARLDRTDVSSEGPIAAVGPPGKVTAGHMHFSGTAENGYVLVFKDGVRLIYDPQRFKE